MNDINQIIEDAAEACACRDHAERVAIIKTAIEKSVEPWRQKYQNAVDDLARFVSESRSAASPATVSEPMAPTNQVCPQCGNVGCLTHRKPDSDSVGKDDHFLLPCPFCGSENVGVEPLVGGFVVDCKDCGGGCGTCHNEQAAREEWNKRKSLREVLKGKGIDSDKVTANIEAMVSVATPSGGGLNLNDISDNALNMIASGINHDLSPDDEEYVKGQIDWALRQAVWKQDVRIYTRCPACQNDTLTINKGHLLCTWHECPNPTAIESLPRDCGEDTKRLDWLLTESGSEWFF